MMMQAIASILHNIVFIDDTSLDRTIKYKRKALSSSVVVLRPLSLAITMIEGNMYREASSFAEYADMASLPDRIRDNLSRGYGNVEFTVKEREKEIEGKAPEVDDEGSVEEDMNMQIVFESLDRGSEVSNLAVPAPKRKRVRSHISKEQPAAVEGLFSSFDFLAHEMKRKHSQVQVQVHGSSTLCGNSETQQSVSGVTDAEKEETEEGGDCQPAPACPGLVTDDVSGGCEDESKAPDSGLPPRDASTTKGSSDAAHTESDVDASKPKASEVELDLDLTKSTCIWQNDPATMRYSRNRRHKFRVAIRDEIPKILQSFSIKEVISEKDIIDLYSTHIHHLERCLHAEASSKQEYCDKSTLKDRLLDLLHRIDNYMQPKKLE